MHNDTTCNNVVVHKNGREKLIESVRNQEWNKAQRAMRIIEAALDSVEASRQRLEANEVAKRFFTVGQGIRALLECTSYSSIAELNENSDTHIEDILLNFNGSLDEHAEKIEDIQAALDCLDKTHPPTEILSRLAIIEEAISFIVALGNADDLASLDPSKLAENYNEYIIDTLVSAGLSRVADSVDNMVDGRF